MKNLKTNHEALNALDDRAREYLAYMNATLKGASDDLYICYPNGKKEWVRDIAFANKYLLSENPYAIWFDGDQDDEPCIQTFDTFEEMKMWAHLTRAIAILEKSDEPTFYWNYAYSVNEKGGYFND